MNIEQFRKYRKYQIGGIIPKYGFGNAISKAFAYIFNNYGGSFNEAYKQARENKDQYFRWNGKLYNTNYKFTPKKESNNNSKSNLDIEHRFNSKNFNEFVSVMYPIFKEALISQGFGLNQIQNLIRQAAFESDYGTQALGDRSFNLGGIKWFNDSKSATYNYKHSTNEKDNLEYIDFDNLLDYANYKVWLLNDTYKALDAKDTNDFVDRLHGNNPSKKSYSANRDGYFKTLNDMISLDRAYNNYVKTLVD